MALIARGHITISTVEDGANAVSIYIRSHAAPSTPTGTSPSGWNVNPDSFASSYGVLWVSDALKSSDGTLTGAWSKPRMYEPYNSNLLWNFPWSLGSGSTSIYSQNGSPNCREMHETPFGYDDIVWRGVSEGNDDSDGGFNAYGCKIDHTKAYRMSCWFKRTSMDGTSYIGANGASKSVQVYSGGAWVERTNFYFWSGDLPEINKWYLLVGYMYGSGETKTTADPRAGIYDPVTGKKVVSFSAVSRNYPNVTKNGIRVYQYYCNAANISAYFWSPRVDMLDGREPSVEELLKKSQDGATGEDGRGVLDISEQFYLSTSKSSPQGGSWSDTKPSWVSGKYMWIRTKVTYTSGTPNPTYTDPYLDSSWEAIDELYDDIEDAKQAGVDAQKVADAITKKAEDEGWATKLTHIDESGIFTGTLSSNTVNSIRINASQITAGTISADRIDTAALKSVLITASNINALTLDVVKGEIGGWSIASGSMRSSNIVLDSTNKRIAVYGASSSSTSGHRAQLYYNNNNDFGFYASNSSGSVVAQFGSTNRVAGWNITTNSIYKNSIYLGSDGSIYNSSNRWRLSNDGSGRLANGNIVWNSAGTVTFSSAVSLNWKNAIEEAVDGLNVGGVNLLDNSNFLVTTVGTDTTKHHGLYASLWGGYNGGISNPTTSYHAHVDNSTFDFNVVEYNESDGNRNWKGISCSLKSKQEQLTTAKELIISLDIYATAVGASNKVHGGFYYRKKGGTAYGFHSGSFYIYPKTANKWERLFADVPFDADEIDWDYSINFYVYGYGFSNNAIIYIANLKLEIGNKATSWSPSTKEISDKLTRITSEGIYTGTLTASQVNAVAISANSITTGILSADRIATGSITASKLNANSIKSEIINTSYINGLSCSFTKGTIGGWTINSGSISGNNIILNDTNNRIAVYATGSSSTSGHRVQLYYSSNSSFGFYATDSSGNCIVRLGSSNLISGWQIANGYIKKNSVYLGSDGSIYNGSKWRLSNDGSGFIASGNISWNTAGAVTFSSAVSLLWKNDIEAAKTANYGYRYYKSIIINGEDDVYYPVVIKGGDQTVKRDILIRRSYNEQAPSTWHNSTHKGGLIMHMKTNFGGWGGAAYSWEIYELSETYCRMFAGAQLCGNSVMFAIFLRGGGTTGAKYHIYSNQPLDDDIYSPAPIPASPQIAYDSDKIFSSGSYQAYAPAPRTLTEAVEDEIRRKRFVTLAQNSDTTLQDHPLTYIGSTGIYTGTLTASQVNAVAISASSITTGTLSASRIAAGSIDSTKLNADSIKANIINTSYINGLTCTFTKGTIGGWNIASGVIYNSCLRIDNANRRIVVHSSTSGPTSGQRVQMYYNSNSDFGFYTTNSSGSRIAQFGSSNIIAGWNITTSSIYKNSIYLGSDGSIYNSSNKWRLANDGSGRLANGNISWNSSGTVTFSSSVSLNWTNAATNALNSAKSYADTKKAEAISSAASDATTKANAAAELASAMANGRMIYRDPTFFNGSNSISIYNNNGNGTVTHSRKYISTAPNDSKYILEIKTTGDANPGSGGFYFGTTCSYRKVFITRIIAKIPSGRSIAFATNSMGSGGTQKWLTPVLGTGDWCEYVCKVTCGTSSFSSTNFFYITGETNVTWYVSYATVFDTTSVEKFTTTIDGNGIYTGSLNANQITAGTIHSSRIDTNSIKAAIVTASSINALTLTTTKGSIGGWTIASSYIRKNSVYLGSDGSIYNGSKWRLNNNGSGQLANGNITWDTSGNITARNAKFTNVRIQGSLRNPFVLNDSSIWVGGSSSNQENFNNYDNIVAIRGSWNEHIDLPWTNDQSGRRVTLINYKWGSSITTGYMDISAPSGKYFYEDGISKSRISFSREIVELLGYGDSSTFFGWIVVNRLNLMTTSRYGKPVRILAQGRVTGTKSSASITYKTFDNTSMSVSRIAEGKYRVNYSSTWGLTLANAVFNLTGYGYSVGSSTAPVKASVYGVYSSYFYVNVSDDASNNDGSFYFQITNMNDWTY